MNENDKQAEKAKGGCVMSDLDLKNVTISAARMQNTKPSDYRLVKRGSDYVLQGCFTWTEGSKFGAEWRDLPTVTEEQP